MVNLTARILLITGVLMIFACRHVGINNSVPALLSGVDEATKSELNRTVAQLLNRDAVFIAQDAFQNRSFISIERLPLQDSNGNRIQGRKLDMPEKIQLFLINGECILKRESNNATVKLENVKCFPEN